MLNLSQYLEYLKFFFALTKLQYKVLVERWSHCNLRYRFSNGFHLIRIIFGNNILLNILNVFIILARFDVFILAMRSTVLHLWVK